VAVALGAQTGRQVAGPPALQVVGVSRSFGDVQALRDVDVDVRAGEVLAILGENGAGKTTLIRILGGLDQPSSGEVFRAGERFAPASPREAVERGVTLVQQHFALVPTMNAVDNLQLFRAQRHRRSTRAAAAADLRALAARLGFEIDPAATVASMSVGERQRLELLRALDANPEILLLDEPTAVLTDAEADRLLGVVRRLAEDGRAVVLITHRLREVVEAADRVAVLRNGVVVSPAAPVGDRTRAALAHEMVGEELPTVRRTRTMNSRVVITVDGLRAGRLEVGRLTVHAGEVLGVAGVDGNGQVELELALTGLAAVDAGSIEVDGDDVTGLHPRERVARGIAYIPSDRAARALVGSMRCDENLALGRTAWRIRRDPTAAARMATWAIKGVPGQLAESLSGGNAQKLVAARELHDEPRAVVACQPTRGLDPAAAVQLRAALLGFADRGGAVVWIAAELDELLEVADRIVVAFHGRLSDPFAPPYDRRRIGLAMGGGE
jgi:general nucleoside transport system ATP-binding protein